MKNQFSLLQDLTTYVQLDTFATFVAMYSKQIILFWMVTFMSPMLILTTNYLPSDNKSTCKITSGAEYTIN